jgi:hypothetical protein
VDEGGEALGLRRGAAYVGESNSGQKWGWKSTAFFFPLVSSLDEYM